MFSGSGGFAGTVTISSGGTLELATPAVLGSAPITFAGSAATLRIDGTVMPSDVISGMTLGDTVDLASVAFGADLGLLTSGNVLQITESGSTYELQLNPAQNLSGFIVVLASDGTSGTDVSIEGLTIVSSGQVVSNSTIPSGGIEDVYGITVSMMVAGGGYQNVLAGGTAGEPRSLAVHSSTCRPVARQAARSSVAVDSRTSSQADRLLPPR